MARKNVQKTTFEAAEMILGPWNQQNDSYKWKGPGTVLSQEEQQILVKHGGVYVMVHPCRLLHKVTPEECQDSEGESRNVQKSETEHVVQKCKSVDEPEKQVVSDDDYDV